MGLAPSHTPTQVMVGSGGSIFRLATPVLVEGFSMDSEQLRRSGGGAGLLLGSIMMLRIESAMHSSPMRMRWEALAASPAAFVDTLQWWRQSSCADLARAAVPDFSANAPLRRPAKTETVLRLRVPLIWPWKAGEMSLVGDLADGL